MRAIFNSDFDLKKQVKVKSKHTGLSLFVTPRYIDHYVKHDYEPFSVAVVQHLVEDIDTFVDIGAHYGYYGLVAHQRNPLTQVIAIEPVTENFSLLKKNLEFNKVPFEAHNIAASNEDAVVTFNIIEASDSCSFYQHPLAEVKSTTTVQAKRLDSILHKGKLFIKMDVEGHEIKVLDGMRKTLSNLPPLLIEFNPDCQKMAGFQPEQILKKISALGYTIYFLNETSYETQVYNSALPKNWRNFMAENDYCNILCLKKGNQSKIKNIFNALLIAKFIGSNATKVTEPEKFLQKTKSQLEKKITNLEKQKRVNQIKLSRILKSDYFKAWQYLVSLMKKNPS